MTVLISEKTLIFLHFNEVLYKHFLCYNFIGTGREGYVPPAKNKVGKHTMPRLFILLFVSSNYPVGYVHFSEM